MSTSQLRQAASAPAPGAARTIIDILRTDKVKDGLRGVATKYLNHDRMLKLAVNAISRTPNLQRCQPMTVLGAIMTSTALGLEPNTPFGQAYLIPYKKRAQVDGKWIDVYECQFQVGYRGFITLAYRLPGLRKFQSEAIHANDKFSHQLGTETFLRYEKVLKDRGELTGAFCYTEIGGGEAATVLPWDEIERIRSRSETYRSLSDKLDSAEEALRGREGDRQAQKDFDYAAAKFADTPWEMWQDDMAAKSAIKKHCKKLPQALGVEGSALGAAAEIDGDSAKLIDIAQMADPDFTKAVIDGDESAPEGKAVTHEKAEHLDMNLVSTKQGEKVAATQSSDEGKPAAQQQKPADLSDMSNVQME